MNDIQLNIQGLEEVKKMLSTLPDEVSQKVMADVAKKAGVIVANELKAASPDGVSNKKTTIKVTGKGGKQRSVNTKLADNVIVKGNKDGSASIGYRTRVFYAKFLNFGTKVRELLGRGKYKKGTNRGAVTGTHFVEKAHEAATPKVLDFLTTNVISIISKSIKRQLNKIQGKQ